MPATILSLSQETTHTEPQANQQVQFPRLTPPKQHTYFDDRPTWDAFGLSFFTQTCLNTDESNTELLVAAQGLVLPNKVNLRQKTQGHLFPIELGGLQTDRNILSDWLGPNYAIPLRALASRTMALQPTFNHSGWHRQRTPKQGLMARFDVVRQADNSISHLRIIAWPVDITSGEPCEETATEWEIPNRF